MAAFVRLLTLLLFFSSAMFSQFANAQKNQPGGSPAGQGPQSSSPPGGGSSSLQGVSWAHNSWTDDLGLPNIKNMAVACYTLVPGNSAAQPFLLQPSTTDDQVRPFNQDCTDQSGQFIEAKRNVCEAAKKRSDAAVTQEIARFEKEIANQKASLEAAQRQNPVDTDLVSGLRALVAANEKKIAGAKTKIDDKSFKDIQWSPCTHLDSDRPLIMGQTLVIGIDTDGVPMDRVRILNLNVTNQQGNPINPTPVRPSFGGAGSTPTNLGKGGPFYLTWPNQIPGDTIATVSVNLVYTPPVPGDKWSATTIYPAGTIVTSDSGDGHYYLAVEGGISRELPPPFMAPSAPQVRDGSIVWIDSGNTAPQGGGPGGQSGGGISLWASSTDYNRGSTVYDPYNGHYYTNVLVFGGRTCGTPPTTPCGATGAAPTDPFSLPTWDGTVTWADRGSTPPAAPYARWLANTKYNSGVWIGPENDHYYQAVQPATATSGPGPFAFPQVPRRVTDGTVVWELVPQTTPPPATTGPWKPFHEYQQDQLVDSSNGNIYKTATPGRSGAVPSQPFFALTSTNVKSAETLPVPAVPPPPGEKKTKVPELLVTWDDLGTTPPSSISGGQPADQVVNLLNLQFSQSHSLSYFNVASGVVYSTVRSPSFGFSCKTTNGTQTCTPVQTSSSPTIDPVLLFTAYPKPWDAERHCPHNFCLIHPKTNPPGITFGFSLSNPASSFYVGASFELLRNIQIVGGANFSKQATLPPPGTQQPSSGTPVTVQRFQHGGFAGLTLNISGFIQSLFSGGGGGGGGKSGGS